MFFNESNIISMIKSKYHSQGQTIIYDYDIVGDLGSDLEGDLEGDLEDFFYL